MKHSKLALVALTLASSFATSGALADYRLTAFSDTAGFKALVEKDTVTAESAFASLKLTDMDYFEANNLCVSQILVEEFDAAIVSCSAALEKAELSTELTVRNEKIALASVYSNLAVAKVMTGDTSGANIDLEKALSLNLYDGNASINYGLISSNLVVVVD
ncbi:MAG: hypothetical protein DHS20C12_16220 [Pseudohongiella sp.]|nr:MAG: hypothetical protein DHS20C12_16220 [Pseudohongiella sp.]